MKTEEKAKKYDEALEWMRKVYPTLTGADKEEVEHYFPELKESEDERMLGAIRLALTDVPEERFTTEGTSLSEVLAWMEKHKECGEANFREGYLHGFEDAQKEQKPSINIDQLKSLMLQYLQEASNEKEDSDIEADTDKWARKILGYDFEQKPVDDKAFEEWIDVWYNEHHRDGYITMDEREFKNFCRGIRNMYQQKPAEWSEEDKETIDLTIAVLKVNLPNGYFKTNPANTLNMGAISTDQLINRLKSLRPQPKPEWSDDYREEDIQTRFAFYTYKDDPSTLYLSNVFVEEASRKKGFGTRILRAAEKVAETIGATIIRLKVKQDSPANNWYRKNGYGYVTFEDGYDWLEKNLEYLKPAKSAVWSEEDEAMRDNILRLLSCFVGTSECDSNPSLSTSYPAYQKEIDWLKSLPLNLKKKNEDVDKLCSNEWSEEDKHRCKDAIYFLETAKKHYASTSEIELTIEWLKSLQPQTKQEQTTFL